jgi:hypothetical protein
MTIYDQQSGKEVSGEVQNVGQYTFELVTADGAVLIFPRDHLPKGHWPHIDTSGGAKQFHLP